MIFRSINVLMYGLIVLSLFAVDHFLGEGLLETFRRLFCKISCFVRKTIKEEETKTTLRKEIPISLHVLLVEVLVLFLSMAVLKRFKKRSGKARIDELLEESKEAIQISNGFLDKWRLRHAPLEYSYLDEEPEEIKPLRVEVPILHMAIVDTLGTTRSQPERGDAGDTINFTDSAVLSMTSLLDDDDDDLESISDCILAEDPQEVIPDQYDMKPVEFSNRYLWDVLEEDSKTVID